MPRAHNPVGQATRGTTNTNRLRRVDRWLARHPVLRQTADPLVIDLGFGASAVTTLELAERLRLVRADVEVRGLEIDPVRVARANEQLAAVREGTTPFRSDSPVSFGVGGFEVPLAGGRRPAAIRAFNVLRQYDESDVPGAWGLMTSRLAPDGILVEGTCDEIGRVCTWIEVGADAAPRSLTISLRVADLDSPLIAAERLPKALIHRNVAGERIHEFLLDLDRAWERAAGVGSFGANQRWRSAIADLAVRWPLRSSQRWRLGELTVDWSAVAPN